jgi:hypothetical protein
VTRYPKVVDFRRALEARLKSEAESAGSDYARLRRIVVFDRIGARLSASDQGWVLKGGTALEFRLGLRARATKDLDLVLRSGPSDGAAIRVDVVLLPVELAATERISLPGKLEWAEIRPRTIEQDLTAALNTLRAFWARTISTGATT